MIVHPRLKLFLLMMAFVLPIVIAAILYLNIDKMNFTTTNAGDLILPPLPSQILNLQTDSGKPWQSQEKWWVVYYTPSECDKICVFNLEKIDSVRRAMGRELDRIQTLLLSTEEAFSPIPGMASAQLDPLVFKTFSQPAFEALFKHDMIFIIDPQGFIILKYDQKTPGNAILRDLRHLLKVSQVG